MRCGEEGNGFGSDSVHSQYGIDDDDDDDEMAGGPKRGL